MLYARNGQPGKARESANKCKKSTNNNTDEISNFSRSIACLIIALTEQNVDNKLAALINCAINQPLFPLTWREIHELKYNCINWKNAIKKLPQISDPDDVAKIFENLRDSHFVNKAIVKAHGEFLPKWSKSIWKFDTRESFLLSPLEIARVAAT